MPALHIRDVSEETVAAIKARAARNGRSVQKELREALDRLAHEPVPGRARGPLALVTVRTGNTRTWSREDIYADDE